MQMEFWDCGAAVQGSFIAQLTNGVAAPEQVGRISDGLVGP